ncbi:MAG: hypothetical protein IJS66_07205 [Bacteroidales bacterium]|nr:hypothetical protein [Bacteroidales bacterium]
MNNIELKTPEGYFKKSYGRTMSGVAAIRKKRRTVTGMVAIVAVVFGVAFSSFWIDKTRVEKDYTAFQAEMAEFDIFLEIN